MKILLAGDSTVADYPENQRPMAGWGQMLRTVLPTATIQNFAQCGASTQSFKDTGRWAKLIAATDPGDLVLIQFGHNDQKPENGVSRTMYRDNLVQMVHDVQERGGQPMLCTPTERRRVTAAGQYGQTLTDMTFIVKETATATNSYLIDLNGYSFAYYCYSHYGETPEATKENFVWLKPGENANYPAGHEDNTHFSEAGALVMARYVALRLRPWVNGETIYQNYYYGAATYPEVWDMATVTHDIAEMKKLHMNFTRIGEFMWSVLEPAEDQFDFSFLETVLTLYADAGIAVVVGTPTPTPPRWLTYQHPERCVKNSDGTIMAHGSRQHVCTNNAYFRNRAYRMTQQLTRVLRRHDNVIGIQLDNEFKCHVDMCYCDSCAAAWKNWLALKYGTITQLNTAWGTCIFSEVYDSFAEVPLPTQTPFIHNAGLQNAFRLFTAESINDFANGLCHIIRQECDLPITHNSALGFNLLNAQLFQQLDVAGFDTYAPANLFGTYQVNLDMYRNVKAHAADFLLLETSTAHAGHIQNYAAPNPPGYLTNEAFLGFAAGLKMFNYWLFRGHRFGVEQPHATVLTAWGEPDLHYDEVQAVGQLVQQMRPVLDRTRPVRASVAIVYSDDARRFFNIETGGYYNYRSLISQLYSSVLHQGVSVEVVQESADLSGFALVLVPFMRHVSPTLLAKLKAFTEQHGKLIIGPMTGDRTSELAWPATNGLGIVGEWLGIHRVRQYSEHNNQYIVQSVRGPVRLDGLLTVFDAPAGWETIIQAPNGQSIFAQGQVNQTTVLVMGAEPQTITDNSWWRRFVNTEIVPYDRDRQYLTLSAGLVKYRRDEQHWVHFYVANMTPQAGRIKIVADEQEALPQYNGKPYASQYIEVPPFQRCVVTFHLKDTATTTPKQVNDVVRES